MRASKSIKSKMGDLQETFGFFRSVVRLATVRAEAVLSFNPFKCGVDLELPSAWAWSSADSGMLTTEALRKQAAKNGERRDVAYTTWLRWSAPLSGSAYSVN